MKINKVSPKLSSCTANWYIGMTEGHFGQYFGSLASVSEGATYLTHDKRYIVNIQDGNVSVSLNSCSHFGAQLLETPGTQEVKKIICPMHKWCFDPCGKIKSAPYLDLKGQVGMDLDKPEFTVWNGYILGFSSAEIDSSPLMSFGKEIGCGAECFNINNFIFHSVREYSLPYPRPLMLINYLDGYHVPLIHPNTFGAVTNCVSYDWEFSDLGSHSRLGYSIQKVMIRPDVKDHLNKLVMANNKDTSEFGWADLHVWMKEKMPEIKTSIDRNIFALWASVYGDGYAMFELYEGGLLLAVSYLVNIDPADTETNNKNIVEYYIHKNVPEQHRKTLATKFVHAYEQSAREDDEGCQQLWEGHRLLQSSSNRWLHPELEAGVNHWQSWCSDKFVK